MNEDKKIFWISSYPRSGNTWVRLILCALFFTDDGNLNNFDLLKLLKRIPNFDQLVFFEFIKSLSKKDYSKIFDCDEYNDESIVAYSKYWIEAQKRIAIKGDFALFKTHNARLKINNNYYTDSSTTRGFIYISRDPRDVVISRCAYQNIDADFAVDAITKAQVTSKEKTGNRMPEITLNWGDHYLSWKKFSDVPSLFIKYEDLLNDIQFEIKKIINFFYENYNIKIENQESKIKNTINSTKFEKLKEKELKDGFYKSHSSFFREGKHKQWIKRLNQNQKNILEKKFKNQLIELNYL